MDLIKGIYGTGWGHGQSFKDLKQPWLSSPQAGNWMNNKQQRDTPDLLAVVAESMTKAWKSHFFHLGAFWRGTECHHHPQWCHSAELRAQQTPQGKAPLPPLQPGAPRAGLLKRMGFPHQDSTYFSCFVGGQVCRTTFQSPGAPDEILETS